MAYDSFPILVSRAPALTPYTYTTIADIDMTGLPELSSTVTDASVQNSNIDKKVISSLQRRKPLPLTLNFLPTDATQDNLTGVYFAKINNSFDGYKFSHAASGLLFIASGQISVLTPKSPAEGKLQLDVTLEFSGPMYYNGLLIS